jgi:hypothetical protein
MEGEFSGGLSSPEPSYLIVPNADYYVEIGAGGNSQGNDTIFGKIRSKGGGRKITGLNLKGATGGSGSGTAKSAIGGGTIEGGDGITLQGFKGGDCIGHRNGTGGGGAGEAGENTTTNDTGTKGGDGIESSIDGTPTYRAGGGGGAYISGTKSGGLGGGGNGGLNFNAGHGVANTGSGGGGGQATGGVSPVPGSGGSGVVIIRYPSDYEIIDENDSTLGLTFTTTTIGNDKVTVFTQGIGNIQFNKV